MGVDSKLLALVGQRELLSFARASTGLYALLRALGEKYGYGEVIVPALCCESVALAVHYSGHRVRFADVETSSYTLDPDAVAALLSDHTRAVLVVHLYGVNARAERFVRFKEQYPRLALIEDVAQAIGGRDARGGRMGSSLDYALMSFADDKILPGDGGAIGFSRHAPVGSEEVAQIAIAGDKSVNPELATSLRNLVHAAADLWRHDPTCEVSHMFLSALECYRGLITLSGGIQHPARLEAAMASLESERQQRLRRYSEYRQAIHGAQVMECDGGETVWRCSLLFDTPSATVAATRHLRALDINASNHYFALSILFGWDHCPVAEDITRRVLNLWVSEAVSDETLQQTIKVINGDG